jgi:Trypsin
MILFQQRQAFYQQQQNFQQQPKQCGPRAVCCRKPVRPIQQLQQQQQPIPQANYNRCGVRNAQGINGRVKTPAYVDGNSEFGEYPWQAAILKKDPKESVYVCGGTLIDAQHIVTAAHCVKTYSGFDLRVRLGGELKQIHYLNLFVNVFIIFQSGTSTMTLNSTLMLKETSFQFIFILNTTQEHLTMIWQS